MHSSKHPPPCYAWLPVGYDGVVSEKTNESSKKEWCFNSARVAMEIVSIDVLSPERSANPLRQSQRQERPPCMVYYYYPGYPPCYSFGYMPAYYY